MLELFCRMPNDNERWNVGRRADMPEGPDEGAS